MVGGELFVDETVERLVLIERANDIITIGVGERANPIVAVHQHSILGVGVSSDIQPVAAPPFAVVWRSEQ